MKTNKTDLTGSMRRMVGRKCRRCQGTGEIHWNNGCLPRGFYELVKCPSCKGEGRIHPPNDKLADGGNKTL